MAFLSITDFERGKYKADDAGGTYSAQHLTECIVKYEPDYIYKIFGATEGARIIAYTAPGNTDYDTVIAAFALDNTTFCGKPIYQSLGLKEILKAAVFYEYVKNSVKMTQSGPAKKKAEISDVLSPAGDRRFAENKFNDVLSSIEAIQWYCRNHETAFPDFNGIQITVKSCYV